MKHFYRFLCALLVFAGCDRESETPATSLTDYYPLVTGTYQIYSVDELRYQETGINETLAYELKTEVVDSFYNAAGSLTYVIHRSTRLNESAPWRYIDTWSARVDNNQLVVSEGNTPFVKLIVPFKEGDEWNGNQYNTVACTISSSDGCPYRIGAAGTIEIDGTSYQNSVSVIIYDLETAIQDDVRTEVYAAGIGLVYKETNQLQYCYDKPECFGFEIIESGVKYKQQLKAHGRM